MIGKGIVKFFLVVMAITCLVQYFFIWPTSRIENQADQYAESKVANIEDEAQRFEMGKIARKEFLDSMSSEEVFNIPFVKSYTYNELKRQQLNLGLDLKGGMSVVLQVKLKELLEVLSSNNNDPDFNQALDNANERLKSEQTDFINLFVEEFKKIAPEKPLAPIFSRNPTLKDEIKFNTSDEEVLRVLRTKADETVDLTFKRLKDRIDKYGVTQPNVSLDASRDLITVELPGVENPERARTYLQASAELEFWNMYRISDREIAGVISEADKILENTSEDSGTDTVETSIDNSDNYLFDTTRVEILDSLGNPTGEFETVIDSISLNESDIATSNGPLFKVFTPNIPTAGGLIMPSTVLGRAEENQKDYITSLLAKPEVKALFPSDVKLLWSRKPAVDYQSGEETNQYELYAIKKEKPNDEPALAGDRVTKAFSQLDPMTQEINVTLRMDREGAQTWADITTRAAQDQQRPVAIVLDNEVVSAPSVNTPITDGNSSISGNFSVQEGEDLANILQIGKLPAKTEIVQESLVGPSLGKENINRSIKSLLIGFGIVFLFMILYYGSAGIISNIALLSNVFFIFGALSSYGTVLTLPGIAGIVLTIGMAVDANVIIFERVREELRNGKSLKTAIEDGFKYSYSAIIDANVTTILVAAVLAYFGLGPIKGFAVVLIIGVICTLLTAVLFTRLLVDWWIGRGKKLSFWTGFSENVLSNLNIDWMGKRRMGYIISGILIVASLASIFTRGFELGVDFQGGRSYNIEFVEDIDVQNLREQLAVSLEGQPLVKSIDAHNTFNVTTSYLIDNHESEADNTVLQKLFEGVNAATGSNGDYEQFKMPDGEGTHVVSFSKVGPTIADDIISSSYKATILALILIFIYIFIRFNKWQFSLGAIAALLHDSIILLGIFSLLRGIAWFSMEIDQAFIAALLTVIGYSINDTVVVFDRVREVMNSYVGKSKKEIINMAVNSTFSRTVITSLTTLFVVLILFLFGGTSIKGFAFAILIGILIGTYSSIFIAVPTMAELTPEFKGKVKRKKGEYADPANA